MVSLWGKMQSGSCDLFPRGLLFGATYTPLLSVQLLLPALYILEAFEEEHLVELVEVFFLEISLLISH